MSRLVFLVGEGPTDIGALSREPAFQNDEPGFLQPIVRRILRGEPEFIGRKLSVFGKRHVKGLKEALSKKAYLAAMLAVQQNADVLVFVTDVDKGTGSNTRRQAAIMMEKLHAAIGEGIARAAADGSALPAAVGTPCRTIEAWVLGDPAAIRKVCGLHKGMTISRPPEEMWGAPHEPASGHPKSVLTRLIGSAPDFGTVAEIGERAHIATLRQNCPASFAPFAAELESVRASTSSRR